MILDATIKMVLVSLLLIISIPTTYYFWKMPATKLSPTEKELISFTSQPLTMSPPRAQTVFSALESPIRVPEKQAAPAPASVQTPAAAPSAPAAAAPPKKFPPGPIPAANIGIKTPKPAQSNTFDSNPVVSMIYSEGSIKTAVIDGQMLHEGSDFNKGQIVRIEKSRVLLRRAGKDIWLNME